MRLYVYLGLNPGRTLSVPETTSTKTIREAHAVTSTTGNAPAAVTFNSSPSVIKYPSFLTIPDLNPSGLLRTKIRAFL